MSNSIMRPKILWVPLRSGQDCCQEPWVLKFSYLSLLWWLSLLWLWVIPKLFQTPQELNHLHFSYSLSRGPYLPCHKENRSTQIRTQSKFCHKRYSLNQGHPDLPPSHPHYGSNVLLMPDFPHPTCALDLLRGLLSLISSLQFLHSLLLLSFSHQNGNIPINTI